MEVKIIGKGFNYKYDGLIARAKITELICRVQAEIAKQENLCDHDRLMLSDEGFPVGSFDEEYKNLEKLYADLSDLIDNFR